MVSINVVNIEQALADLRTGYQSDGYDLVVDEVTDRIVSLRVTAGPTACVECLVPKAVAIGMIQAALQSISGLADIQLEYPAENPH